jgi:hypothetical protein
MRLLSLSPNHAHRKKEYDNPQRRRGAYRHFPLGQSEAPAANAKWAKEE